jgi:hypothetical protein
VVPQAWQPDHRHVTRYVPEWTFIVCHPAPWREPLFIFSIFPRKARLGREDWLCNGVVFTHEENDVQKKAYYNDLVSAFLSLIEDDQRKIPVFQDPVNYLYTLIRIIAARIDILQQCVDIESHPWRTTNVWLSVRALARRYEQELAGT